MQFSAKVRTCLWFDHEGYEAAQFYVSLIPGSQIENVVGRQSQGKPLVVEFSLGGAPFMVLNGGPQFVHSEAASISVLTEDQDETDRLWDALMANGASAGQCGWIKDSYGVSWQIVPERLPRLLNVPDREAAGRAMDAMMQMSKLDIVQLQAAFDGAAA